MGPAYIQFAWTFDSSKNFFLFRIPHNLSLLKKNLVSISREKSKRKYDSGRKTSMTSWQMMNGWMTSFWGFWYVQKACFEDTSIRAAKALRQLVQTHSKVYRPKQRIVKKTKRFSIIIICAFFPLSRNIKGNTRTPLYYEKYGVDNKVNFEIRRKIFQLWRLTSIDEEINFSYGVIYHKNLVIKSLIYHVLIICILFLQHIA